MGQQPRMGPPRPQPPQQGLQQFDMEVGYGGYWISLNDHLRYVVAADSLGTTSAAMRRIETQSPVVEGKYLVHATPEHIQEAIKVYCYGQNMVEVMENARTLQTAFTQFDYQIRITLDTHREYWRCQTADWSMERTHTFVHNGMVVMNFQVPRFPTASYEALV